MYFFFCKNFYSYKFKFNIYDGIKIDIIMQSKKGEN